jgi:hypothetical protein
MKARSHPFIRAAIAAAMVAVAVSACAFSPTTGTKGTMPPPGPNGEMDPSAVPDFVAVAGPVGIAGYVAKEAVLEPSESAWPVYSSDLRTVVGHMVPGRGFVALGVDPGSVPTFEVRVSPVEPRVSQVAGVVRVYVRNGAPVEAWVAVITLGQVQPGGAGFPGSGYVGIACLSVPDGSRLVLLNHSPVDPGAIAVKTLHVGGAPADPDGLWVDVLPDGSVQTGLGQPDWWSGDSPC